MSSSPRPSPAPFAASSIPDRTSYRAAPPPAGDRFTDVPSATLAAAARRVLASWGAARGAAEAAPPPEIADVLHALAVGVSRRQADLDAPIDASVCTALGQRLLELLRAEVIGGWSATDVTQADVLAILTAIERVRVAIEPDWLRDFTARVSGPDGLEMLVAIAHDLRSPLTSILFLAETLERGQSGPVNQVQRRQLALVYGAALGLSAVASDLVELARGGDQLVEQQPVPFSVTGVLESVRDIVRPIAEEKELAVRLLPPTQDQRLGHPVALSRVLLNLTTNALKFTETGYVEIITQETEPDRVEFAVRDSGKGIAPEIVGSLYQPLRRAPGQSKPSFSQTGLGLMMCRKLTAAMGGELKVETRAGWGTRFYFELDLPRCAEPSAAPVPPSIARGSRRRRPKPPTGS